MGRSVKKTRKPSGAYTRCQAILPNNERCSREAVFKLDLKKSRKVMGIEVPTTDCCKFCTQHVTMYITKASLYGIYASIFLLPHAVRTRLTHEQQMIWDAVKYI